jgi:uncharacterized protein YdeI (YjbR/CyaY-like superfamily)
LGEVTKRYEEFHAHSRADWRAWLAEHHDSSEGVWLVTYKKGTGKPGVTYDEAVEEALCFGWIDSRPSKLDDQRSRLLYTPRRPKSPWSTLNKTRIEQLIAEGLMTPAGLAKIEQAKRDGSWAIYDAIEAVTMPPDLEAALAAVPGAAETFRGFSASATKQLLWHVESAKRPETRAKRIAEIVRAASEGWNALDWQEKKRRERAEP